MALRAMCKYYTLLTPRQTGWWEYLSRFNYDTIHVDGIHNQVVDSLLCYYEYDTIEDEYPNSEFVKVDELLDLDGGLAPIQQFIEIWNNMHDQKITKTAGKNPMTRKSNVK